MTPDEMREALRNVAALLQRDPMAYKRFGIWWWAVKRLLRAAGHTRAERSILGAYEDREQAAMIPLDTPDAVLAAALEEQAFDARWGCPDGQVETPDGEVVTIRDMDAPA